MRQLRLVSLATTILSTMVLAQSTSVSLINQPVVPKGVVASGLSQLDPAMQAKVAESYGKLPLSFAANQGQADGRVKFLSRTGGYTLFLTQDEAVLALRGSKPNTTRTKFAGSDPTPQSGTGAPTTGAVLRMKLRNANPVAKVAGMDELAGTSNYFIGKDPANWRTNVATYLKVKYEGIYSGIDLVYYGNQRQLEYDFIVAPGADPRCIVFDVRGAKRVRRDEHGDLVLKMGEGEVQGDLFRHRPGLLRQPVATGV